MNAPELHRVLDAAIAIRPNAAPRETFTLAAQLVDVAAVLASNAPTAPALKEVPVPKRRPTPEAPVSKPAPAPGRKTINYLREKGFYAYRSVEHAVCELKAGGMPLDAIAKSLGLTYRQVQQCIWRGAYNARKASESAAKNGATP